MLTVAPKRRSLVLPLWAIAVLFMTTGAALALEEYSIEAAINDEWFIINGEKYQAQTYCLGWEEGETVAFIEGSPFGACATATLVNIDRKETCEVWCE